MRFGHRSVWGIDSELRGTLENVLLARNRSAKELVNFAIIRAGGNAPPEF